MKRIASGYSVALPICLIATEVFASADSGKGFPWFYVNLLIAAVFVLVLASKSQDKARKAISDLISRHLAVLVLKHEQTTYQDEYGNWLTDKWFAEIEYFIDNVLCNDPLAKEFLSNKEHRAETRKKILEAVHERIIANAQDGAGKQVNVGSLDPIQYEHHCADLLRSSGWNARVTQASGDQGIDVIATYGSVKAVFQCKKYSQPVGNAAIQEIIAGKQFEQAHIAAVISNAPYTPSAKQLANVTNVFLLHHDELPSFAARVGLVESSQVEPQQEAASS